MMCLKTIGSTGPTDFGNNYVWYSSWVDAGLTKVTSKSDIVNSKNQDYGSGYTNTNYLINKWGKAAAAAYWAKNYTIRFRMRFRLSHPSVLVGFYLLLVNIMQH